MRGRFELPAPCLLGRRLGGPRFHRCTLRDTAGAHGGRCLRHYGRVDRQGRRQRVGHVRVRPAVWRVEAGVCLEPASLTDRRSSSEIRSIVQRAGRSFHSAARSSGWESHALARDDHAVERPSRAAAVRGFARRREDLAHALSGRTPAASDRRAVVLALSAHCAIDLRVTVDCSPERSIDGENRRDVLPCGDRQLFVSG